MSDPTTTCPRCDLVYPATAPGCPRCRSIRATNRVIGAAMVALALLALVGWVGAGLFL